ncbi:MAG: HesA/MoeB/ThiF family protein [Chloroflexi bacterium]|nr:HesA/MoeB/ThiF family protein [Chloroflexota bacterium]
MTTDRLSELLGQYALTKAGDEPPSLSLVETKRLAQICACPLREVEIGALCRHILPERYRRNLGTVGWEGQIALLKATVAVVGAGGLGGWVIEGLARMGVGRLIIIDRDRFEENNLNRQLGCTEDCLGRPKATVLAERVARVNAATETVAHVACLDEANGAELLRGADVLVDALDTLPARMVLQRIAAQLGVPLVHGAIGGYAGQVMTILPGDAGLAALYGVGPLPEHGVETTLGNPAATPMMVSAWQIQEVVKLVTGQGRLLRGRMLVMDAQLGEVTEIQVGQERNEFEEGDG